MSRRSRKSIKATESFILPRHSDAVNFSVGAEELEALRDLSLVAQPSLLQSSSFQPIIPDDSNVSSVELRKKFPNDREWYKRLDSTFQHTTTPRSQKNRRRQLNEDIPDSSALSETETSSQGFTGRKLFTKKKLFTRSKVIDKALDDTTLIDEIFQSSNTTSKNLSNVEASVRRSSRVSKISRASDITVSPQPSPRENFRRWKSTEPRRESRKLSKAIEELRNSAGPTIVEDSENTTSQSQRVSQPEPSTSKDIEPTSPQLTPPGKEPKSWRKRRSSRLTIPQDVEESEEPAEESRSSSSDESSSIVSNRPVLFDKKKSRKSLGAILDTTDSASRSSQAEESVAESSKRTTGKSLSKRRSQSFTVEENESQRVTRSKPFASKTSKNKRRVSHFAAVLDAEESLEGSLRKSRRSSAIGAAIITDDTVKGAHENVHVTQSSSSRRSQAAKDVQSPSEENRSISGSDRRRSLVAEGKKRWTSKKGGNGESKFDEVLSMDESSVIDSSSTAAEENGDTPHGESGANQETVSMAEDDLPNEPTPAVEEQPKKIDFVAPENPRKSLFTRLAGTKTPRLVISRLISDVPTSTPTPSATKMYVPSPLSSINIPSSGSPVDLNTESTVGSSALIPARSDDKASYLVKPNDLSEEDDLPSSVERNLSQDLKSPPKQTGTSGRVSGKKRQSGRKEEQYPGSDDSIEQMNLSHSQKSVASDESRRTRISPRKRSLTNSVQASSSKPHSQSIQKEDSVEEKRGVTRVKPFAVKTNKRKSSYFARFLDTEVSSELTLNTSEELDRSAIKFQQIAKDNIDCSDRDESQNSVTHELSTLPITRKPFSKRSQKDRAAAFGDALDARDSFIESAVENKKEKGSVASSLAILPDQTGEETVSTCQCPESESSTNEESLSKTTSHQESLARGDGVEAESLSENQDAAEASPEKSEAVMNTSPPLAERRKTLSPVKNTLRRSSEIQQTEKPDLPSAVEGNLSQESSTPRKQTSSSERVSEKKRQSVRKEERHPGSNDSVEEMNLSRSQEFVVSEKKRSQSRRTRSPREKKPVQSSSKAHSQSFTIPDSFSPDDVSKEEDSPSTVERNLSQVSKTPPKRTSASERASEKKRQASTKEKQTSDGSSEEDGILRSQERTRKKNVSSPKLTSTSLRLSNSQRLSYRHEEQYSVSDVSSGNHDDNRRRRSGRRSLSEDPDAAASRQRLSSLKVTKAHSHSVFDGIFEASSESEEKRNSPSQTTSSPEPSPAMKRFPSDEHSRTRHKLSTEDKTNKTSDHATKNSETFQEDASESENELVSGISLNPSDNLTAMNLRSVLRMSETSEDSTSSNKSKILSSRISRRSAIPLEDLQNVDIPEQTFVNSPTHGSGTVSPPEVNTAKSLKRKTPSRNEQPSDLPEIAPKLSRPSKSVIPGRVMNTDIRSFFQKSTPLREKAPGESPDSLVPFDASKLTPIKKLSGLGEITLQDDSSMQSRLSSEEQTRKSKPKERSNTSGKQTTFSLQNILNKLHERVPKKTETVVPTQPMRIAAKPAKRLQRPSTKQFQLILPDGKVYKTPKLLKPKKFVSDKMYRFILKRINDNTDLDARVRAEQFVKRLCDTFSKVIKRKKTKELVEDLLNDMVQLGLVSTYSEFYTFVEDFMPTSFRIKAIPCISNDLAPKPTVGIHEKLVYNN